MSEKLASFERKDVTSKGAVSHNVLYYQQFPNARYRVSFYINKYFEKKISIVSGAFNASCLAILNHFLKSCNIIQMGTGVKVRFISEPQVWMWSLVDLTNGPVSDLGPD